MASIEELEKAISESDAAIESLEITLKESRVADLTGLVTKSGKLKGHLTSLTAKQYEKIIGRKPRPELFTREKDATTDKIPASLVLDQIASERGFPGTRGEERLIEAVEKVRDNKANLVRLLKGRNADISDLKDKLEKGTIGKEMFNVSAPSPAFKGTDTRAEVTEVDGLDITARRQHPFWRIDLDKDSDGKPDKSFQIRYADGARKLVKLAAKEHEDKLVVELRRRSKLRITPKRPRLRR